MVVKALCLHTTALSFNKVFSLWKSLFLFKNSFIVLSNNFLHLYSILCLPSISSQEKPLQCQLSIIEATYKESLTGVARYPGPGTGSTLMPQ